MSLRPAHYGLKLFEGRKGNRITLAVAKRGKKDAVTLLEWALDLLRPQRCGGFERGCQGGVAANMEVNLDAMAGNMDTRLHERDAGGATVLFRREQDCDSRCGFFVDWRFG